MFFDSNIFSIYFKDKIQTDIIIAPNGSKISLHQMREEVALAKQKYVELEKTLKLEFEERILKLQLDNSQLREALKEKVFFI